MYHVQKFFVVKRRECMKLFNEKGMLLNEIDRVLLSNRYFFILNNIINFCHFSVNFSKEK